MDLDSIMPESVNRDISRDVVDELDRLQDVLDDATDNDASDGEVRRSRHKHRHKGRSGGRLVDGGVRKDAVKDVVKDTADEPVHDVREAIVGGEVDQKQNKLELVEIPLTDNGFSDCEDEDMSDSWDDHERSAKRCGRKGRYDRHPAQVFRYNAYNGMVEDMQQNMPPEVDSGPSGRTILLIVLLIVVLVTIFGYIVYKLFMKYDERRMLREAEEAMNRTMYGPDDRKVPLRINAERDDVYTAVNEEDDDDDDDIPIDTDKLNRYMAGGRKGGRNGQNGRKVVKRPVKRNRKAAGSRFSEYEARQLTMDGRLHDRSADDVVEGETVNVQPVTANVQPATVTANVQPDQSDGESDESIEVIDINDTMKEIRKADQVNEQQCNRRGWYKNNGYSKYNGRRYGRYNEPAKNNAVNAAVKGAVKQQPIRDARGRFIKRN